jgi:hypothetical protein
MARTSRTAAGEGLLGSPTTSLTNASVKAGERPWRRSMREWQEWSFGLGRGLGSKLTVVDLLT